MVEPETVPEIVLLVVYLSRIHDGEERSGTSYTLGCRRNLFDHRRVG